MQQETISDLASAHRDSDQDARIQALSLLDDPRTDALHTLPFSAAILNPNNQIVFYNQFFRSLLHGKSWVEVIGKRPGEALDCVSAWESPGGCGTSKYCVYCGAASAIIKSLRGKADCRECRMRRMIDENEVNEDFQIYSSPLGVFGENYSVILVLDVSHEKRLAYRNRTFYHGLINAAGGLNTISELMEMNCEASLHSVLMTSTRRIMRDVIYHRDVDAAELGRLHSTPESVNIEGFLKKIVSEECEIRNIQPSVVMIESRCQEITTHKRILGHVVRNLLINALEADREDGDFIHLVCWPDRDGGTAISITNPGTLPRSVRMQMFKRYVSTKSNDRGLGLHVARLFLKQYLGGSLEYESRDDTIIFTIHLPADGTSSEHTASG